jgi:hypothetical protein
MKPVTKGQERSSIPGFFSRISARQRIIAGAVFIVVCTIIAFSARPPDSDRPAGSIIAWFFRPLDPFDQARKPYIKSDLRAIARVPGSETLVAVGSGGLIVRSNDLGKHWEPRIVTLTPEEINRLQETGKKVEDYNPDRRPQEKINPDKEPLKKAGVAASTGDLTADKKIRRFDIDKFDAGDESPRTRKVPELVAPPEQKLLPDTMGRHKTMKK